MYERQLVRQIVARLKEPRRFVQVVMGPQQVGKTTMLKQALAAADVPFAYHSADAVAGRGLEWIGTAWESARTQLRAGGHASFTLDPPELLR